MAAASGQFALNMSSILPLVSTMTLQTAKSFGSDNYGALRVAADYCGLREVPPVLPGCWQHGMIPPWWRVQAEVVVYDTPKEVACFVARQDEATFLKAGGYREARAIGLPIIYTQPSGLQRIPNSLLVMPTHSIPSDVLLPRNDQYVREVSSIKSRFDLVAACVSPFCIARGLWVPQFEEQGIQVVPGADIRDANALKRMRALFESFEYVTTDTYGSHVFYALYFGAKVSIWGTATPVLRENVLSDGGWARHPEAVDAIFSREAERKAEVYLGPLRVDPWTAVQNVDVGKFMLGHDHKLSPRAMRAAFGWTPLSMLVRSAKETARRSPFWRAASAVKRRLLAPAPTPDR